MKCLYCNGHLKPSEEVYHADRKGIHLTIDRLKVYKCDKCGEILVGTQEIKLIQNTLSNLEQNLVYKVA